MTRRPVHFLVVGASLMVAVTACDSDGGGHVNEDAYDAVKACIEQGGDPKYTSYGDSGDIALYLGCVEVTTT